MTNTTVTFDPEELLAQASWLRRLARGLVGDEASADDLVQETVMAAAERGPRDRPLGPWLVRVMRNLARMQWRSERRRVVRETRAETNDDAPATPDELLARVETQRRLVRLVVELAEPYRAVVLLHYVEGLSSREIGRRLGVASGTVRWRLKEALDRLRAQLDGEADGDRRAWLVPVGDIALRGGVVMKKLALGFAVVVLLLLIGGVWWLRSPGDAAAPGPGEDRTPGALSRPRVAPGDARAALPAWLAQEGAEPRRIAGRVLRGGTPVANVAVRLQPGHQFGVPPGVLDERRTDDGGRFDFGVRAPAVYLVAATTADASPAVARVAVADPRGRPPSDDLVLELGPCVTRVTGRVVDVAGPIAGAAVRVADSEIDGGGRLALVTTSDDAGSFAVCLPAGAGRVRVDADGYAAAQLTFHHDGVLERDIVLVPEAQLGGVAVDGRGEPVAGAHVLAVPLAPHSPVYASELAPHAAIADSDGRFEIGGLGPGPYELMAAGDGSAGRFPTPIALEAAESRDVVIELDATARVRGRVTAGDAPVVGATVRISEFTPNTVEPAVTQDDGSFVLSGVPRGQLLIAVSGYEVRRPRAVDVDAAVVDVHVEVEPQASVRGRVTRGGQPVSGARVYAAGGRRAPAITDHRGDYVIEGIPPGQTGVWAANAAVDAVATFRPVTVGAGEVVTVDIELDHAAVVAGLVVDTDERPVSSAYVRLHMTDPADDGYCTTDTAGAFRCPGLLGGGVYRLSVYPSPAATTPFRLAPGAIAEVEVLRGDSVVTGVRLAIEHEQLTISGEVVDDAGSPVADAYVVVDGGQQPPLPGAAPPDTARTDTGGRFELRGLAPGSYALRARATTGEAVVASVVAGTRDARIELQRFGSIEGAVVGFGRGVRVSARSRELATHGITWGEVTGTSFRFDALPPGDYYVTAQEGVDGAELDAAAVTVRAGGVSRLELTNRGTAEITGVVTELDSGAPVAGMFCNATVAVDGVRANNGVLGDPTEPGRITDAAGRYALARAPAGDDVRVECWSPDVALSHAAVNRSISRGARHEVALHVVRRAAGDLDLGVWLDPWTIPALIGSVDPGGIGAAAHLAPGDRIVEVAGVSTLDLSPDGVAALAQNCVRAEPCEVAISREANTIRTTLPHGP